MQTIKKRLNAIQAIIWILYVPFAWVFSFVIAVLCLIPLWVQVVWMEKSRKR